MQDGPWRPNPDFSTLSGRIEVGEKPLPVFSCPKTRPVGTVFVSMRDDFLGKEKEETVKLFIFGDQPEIRTQNSGVLSPMPLPIGLEGLDGRINTARGVQGLSHP